MLKLSSFTHAPSAWVFWFVFSGVANAADLLDTYRLALENDPVFLAAEHRQLAAVEVHPQARAALWPRIDLTANVARTDTNNDQSGAIDSNGADLTLTQSLYNRTHYISLSQADLQVGQAEAAYISARQSLLLRSAEHYFSILAAQDNREFARSEKSAIQRQLEQAERRFAVGLIAITDVKEAQAQHDLAAAREITADNQLATAREALRMLTGNYPESLRTLGEKSPLVVPEPDDIDAWVDIATDNSPPLQSARLASEIARLSIARERAAYLPNTELIGSYRRNHSDNSLSDSESTQLRIQVSVPLYTGGAISSRVRQASANSRLAREQLDSQRRVIVQQTRDAYRSVRASISLVGALQQALGSTQSSAEATRAGFDVGTRTTVEVLNALRETYRAQADYLSARYNYILDTLRLKQAAGVLTPEDIERVNRWLTR